jgi:hypothetical protein
MNIRQLASKIKIAVLIAASLLAVYAVLGFYGLPLLIKSKLPVVVQQAIGRKASVSIVRFDPFSLQLSLHGFELQETNGRLFVGFDEFFVDIDGLQSISQAALVIDKVSLTKPVFNLVKYKDSTFNFKDLNKQKSGPKQDSGKIFPINIVKLSITEGKLDWKDEHSKSP